jgi:hypothetical protein
MSLATPEIVVIGAGVAGVSAAIAAAQENKKVVLIEKSNSIGGNATHSNVGTICGAYYRTFSKMPRMVEHPFLKKIISKLIAISEQQPINYHKGLFTLPYEWTILQALLEKQLIENKVEVLKNTEIIEVQKDNNHITQLIVKQRTQQMELHPEKVIDCSGNGIISQLLNLEMITSPSYQSASQIFRVNKILSDNEFSLNMALKKAMMQLVTENKWPESFLSLSIVPGSLKNAQADLKITLPEMITDNSEENATLNTKAKTYVTTVFPYLTKRINSFTNAEITTIFPQLGIRIQQRSKGKYVLTEGDVLSCEKFDDGIAVGTWPIEEWNDKGKLNMDYFEEENGYTIPANCLISNQIDNLFFAGKNISATTKAIASARIMGTCLQTGYAAGKMASCKNEKEKIKMITLLNKELLPE